MEWAQRRRPDAALLGGIAGLDRNDVRAHRPNRQGGADAGEHVGVLEVAMQRQHLDQRPGAGTIAETLACGGPERVMR